jgi:DNA-binding transcriptional MerR regulator
MITSELAKQAQVSADTVRYYTKRGLLIPTRDPENGYKIYDLESLKRLKFIHQAREIGFSLKDIEEILAFAREGDSPCPRVRAMMAEKIQSTRAQIAALQNHLAMLESTFAEWEHMPNSTPDHGSICSLIESWAKGGEA